MILLDSSIIIEFLRAKRQHALARLDPLNLGLISLVRVEVLHGARDPAQFLAIQKTFSSFLPVVVEDGSWRLAEEMAFQLRSKGITLSLVDVVLAATAMETDSALWTLDRDFEQISKRFPSLRIHHPS